MINSCFLTKDIDNLLVKADKVLLPERRPFSTKISNCNLAGFTSHTMINLTDINRKFLYLQPKRSTSLNRSTTNIKFENSKPPKKEQNIKENVKISKYN